MHLLYVLSDCTSFGKNMFKDKTILITGGTGTFGKSFARRIIENHNPLKVIIFSRDEIKQWELEQKINNKKLRFILGDVRDKDRLQRAFSGVDIVVHAAAMKIVPKAEYDPFECIKTNILGAMNVIDASLNAGVSKVVALSTDKASSPVNVYGASKLVSDKVFIAANSYSGSQNTIFSVVRYGNVMGSRGSVIPLFLNQIKTKGEITITNPNMTRFMMSLDEAVALVLYAFEKGDSGDLFIYKSPGATIEKLGKALFSMTKQKEKVKIIGVRHGEKDHEVLLSKEEKYQCEDLDKFYKVSPDTRELNYENYFSEGRNLESVEEYNSNNTNQLSVEQLIEMLSKNKEVVALLKNI